MKMDHARPGRKKIRSTTVEGKCHVLDSTASTNCNSVLDSTQIWSRLNFNRNVDLSSWPRLADTNKKQTNSASTGISGMDDPSSSECMSSYDEKSRFLDNCLAYRSAKKNFFSMNLTVGKDQVDCLERDFVADGQKKNNNSKNQNTKVTQLLPKEERQRIKEEKRRKREEEIRRQIVAPKSEHFRLIDSKFKELVDSAGSLSNSYSRNSGSDLKDNDDNSNLRSRKADGNFLLMQTLSEFPALNSSNKLKPETDRNSIKQMSVGEQQVSSVANCVEKSTVKDTFKNNVADLTVASNAENKLKPIGCIKDVKNSKSNFRKKIKRSTPIEFNLINALQQLQIRRLKLNGNKRNSNKSARVLGKKNTLSGNKLDSDNPIRKKGKYRENKKGKNTKLKKCLINERELRRCLVNDANTKLITDKRLFIESDVDKSLMYWLKKEYKEPMVLSKEVNISCKNEVAEEIGENGIVDTKPQSLMHTRKFKSYCDQWPSVQMQESICNLFKTVVRFQDRHHANDPIKAHAKRRYVCGFHEVMKFVKVNKAKLIVIATDIDCGSGEDESSLMNCINQLKASAEAFNVPYVFCGTRWSMRNALKKKRPISCTAVLNYEGAEEVYKNIMSLLPRVKNMYQEKLKAMEAECGVTYNEKDDVTGACIRSMLDRLTVSNCEDNLKSGNEGVIKDSLIEKPEDNDCPFMNAILKCGRE